jgi:hypothetical protein
MSIGNIFLATLDSYTAVPHISALLISSWKLYLTKTAAHLNTFASTQNSFRVFRKSYALVVFPLYTLRTWLPKSIGLVPYDITYYSSL